MNMTTMLDQEEQEVLALVALRDSFLWPANDAWPSRINTLTEYCTMIPGITCNPALPTSSLQRGQVVVTAIDFAARQLKGTIPSEIGYLTNLVRLKLGDNRLHGTLPSTLSYLTLLEQLEVNRNNLTGTLPMLSPLTKLKRLLIQSNQFQGTLSHSLCDLTSLTALNLSKNLLEGTIPACFANMEQLQTLQIQNNRLTGTVPVAIWERMGLNSSMVVCPMGTYSPLTGRQSTSTECLPCPTAMYLGSTTCPESPSPTIIGTMTPTGVPNTNGDSAPSVVPQPVMPVRVTSIEPSSSSWQPVLTTQPTPWNDDAYHTADEWNDHDLSDVIWGPPSNHVSWGTDPMSTEGSSVSTTNTAVPFSENTSSTGPWTDLTLVTAAFFLSAVALLVVVVTRRHVKVHQEDRRPRQPDEEDKDGPPISSLILVPTLSDDPHSLSCSSSTNSCDAHDVDLYSIEEKQVHDMSTNTSSPERSVDNHNHHHHHHNKTKDDGNGKHNNDNESWESDSGWDDTESSIDDDDDDDDDHVDDTSKEDKKKDLHISMYYRWGSFFVNPMSVPV